MKYGFFALGLALCIGLHQLWLADVHERATHAALTDDARLAIDVRCRDRTGHENRECREMLERLYLSGSLDPDKTLRTWCDSVKEARWGGSRPAPPELCVERYGGWQEG